MKKYINIIENRLELAELKHELEDSNKRQYMNIAKLVYGDTLHLTEENITRFQYINLIQLVYHLELSEQIAIKAYCRYGDYHKASKMTKIDQKILARSVESAIRHLRGPQCISFLDPSYYDKYTIKGGNVHPLSKYDFGGKQYIVTALNNCGIKTREALLKHLSNGWYYLWTIPGCGDTARQYILMALDQWDITIKRLS